MNASFQEGPLVEVHTISNLDMSRTGFERALSLTSLKENVQ